MDNQEQGVPPSGSGCQPSASAADARSQSGIPNADWLLSELSEGIANLKKAIAETPRQDVFWSRYWDGYLKGYEGLWAKAIAMEARRAETGTGSVHDSAGRQASPEQGLSPPKEPRS